MTQLFAVIRTHGGGWLPGVSLTDQPQWDAHAKFMDALYDEGFAVLVGPLEGTETALIIARAESADEIERRLADDPWTKLDLLRTTTCAPWTLRLGSLERRR